jgi:hypothetical protein
MLENSTEYSMVQADFPPVSCMMQQERLPFLLEQKNSQIERMFKAHTLETRRVLHLKGLYFPMGNQFRMQVLLLNML